MKKLFSHMALLTALLFSVAQYSHGHGNHEVIGSRTAITMASQLSQQLIKKDFGYKVGKLDASWAKLEKKQFKLLKVTNSHLIVTANNPANQQQLYFLIANNGQIEEVAESLEALKQ